VARGFCIAAAVAACVAASDAPRGFSLAVLRRDGILIPFANFDGSRWRNTWPAPRPDLMVPINLASIPSRWWGPPGARETWQAWVDGTPVTVRVVQPDWTGVQCTRRITLRSDYRASAALPRPDIQPYPKDGIAVSPPQPIDRVDILPITGRDAVDLAAPLLDAFNRAERQTEARYGHPLSRHKREGVAPSVEALYGYGDGATRVYYVEAVRTYRVLGQSPGECTASGVGTGWFVRADDKITPLLMTVDLLDCDRRTGSYMLPLGAMRVGPRSFWFAQFSGWDHERYVVIELTPKRVEALVSTWGGGC